jgi:hypothetical protein
MKIFAYLTEIFIVVFGITRPSPEQERLANLLIGSFVLTLIAGACGVIGFTVYTLSSR